MVGFLVWPKGHRERWPQHWSPQHCQINPSCSLTIVRVFSGCVSMICWDQDLKVKFFYICVYVQVSIASIFVSYVITYIYIYIYIYNIYIYVIIIYLYIYIYIHIYICKYMLSWKQCALPAITTMALWQLMHLGTWARVHELPQSHCGDNKEGTLFSW